MPRVLYLVYVVDDSRLCDTQQVVVALQRVRVLLELLAPEVLLLQAVLLDHGTHPAIQYHDPLLQDCPQLRLHRTAASWNDGKQDEEAIVKP